MLSRDELVQLMEKFKLPEEGRRLVWNARENSPIRKVKASGGNVVTHYFSRKMGRILATESHTAEQVGAHLYEFDRCVLEYYAQPCELDLKYTRSDTGKVIKTNHKPDFLVITDEYIAIDEWKQEEHLVSLSKEQPDRYSREGLEWRSPVLEERLRPTGIMYRLRSPAQVNHTRVSNLRFLADYLLRDSMGEHRASVAAVSSCFRDVAEIPLQDLIEEGCQENSAFTVEDVYQAIAVGEVVFDMDGCPLAETDRIILYRDMVAMRLLKPPAEVERHGGLSVLSHSLVPGGRVFLDDQPFDIVTVGSELIYLQGKSGLAPLPVKDLIRLFENGGITLPATPLVPKDEQADLRSLSTKDMEEIERRRAILIAAETPGAKLQCSRRTVRRYQKAVRAAGDSPWEQHLALVPGTSKRGNRTSRLSADQLQVIEEIARKKHNKPSGPSKKSSYRDFVALCDERAIEKCSRDAFYRHLKVNKVLREGRRNAYQQSPIVWYLHWREPIHGVRPFEYVHIDATPVELVLIKPGSKQVLGTVWLYLAVDAATRLVVGFHLSFQRPSTKTTLMVIRDIVRRHGRMPETLILDHGPEHEPGRLRRLCELCGTSIRQRPAGQPRGGTVIERLFGVTQQDFIHLLEGNKKLSKSPRTLTKAVRPENFGAWTLPALHRGLEEYWSLIYGTEVHPALGESPQEHFDRRLRETGNRDIRLVKFDRLFLIETCPAVSGDGTREVDSNRGIKVNYIWYWAPVLSRKDLKGKKVLVREDPWDPGVTFALVDGVWHECVSKYRALLSHYTSVELRYHLNTLKETLGARKRDLTQERLAQYLRLQDPRNFDPRLRAQQEESRLICEELGMAAVGGPRMLESDLPLSRNRDLLAQPNRPTLSAAPPEVVVEEVSEQTEIVEAELLPPENEAPRWSVDNDFTLF